jgi:hypothetical protein
VACHIAGAPQLYANGIKRLVEQPNLHTVSLTGCTFLGRTENSIALLIALSPKCTTFRLRDSAFDAEQVRILMAARSDLGISDLDLFICEHCYHATAERAECGGGKECSAFEAICKDCAIDADAIACPNCDDIFCEPCATWQGRSNGFSYCQGKSPPPLPPSPPSHILPPFHTTSRFLSIPVPYSQSTSSLSSPIRQRLPRGSLL